MLDMDGTIYNEDTLIPGASEFFDLLNEQGKDYVYLLHFFQLPSARRA